MGLALAHREFGGGPPLVVLHGLFGSGRNWVTVAQRLAESWKVYTLDLRNHGESPWAEEMDYRVMAADVVEFLERREIESATLLGHSMGGKTAMALALMDPERIRALVVVDIAPVTYGHRHQTYVEAMQSLDLIGLRRRAEVDERLRPFVPDRGIRGFLMQNLVPKEGGFAWRLNLAALGTRMSALSGFPDEVLDRVYRGRTLFLGGGLSDYIMPEHHAPIYRLFPNSEIQDIPGVGHWVHAEAPESFLAHVRSFLAGTSGGIDHR